MIVLSILSSSLYGLSDEIHQYFVAYRDADIMDILADMAGSICGVYIFKLFLPKLSVSNSAKER